MKLAYDFEGTDCTAWIIVYYVQLHEHGVVLELLLGVQENELKDIS